MTIIPSSSNRAIAFDLFLHSQNQILSPNDRRHRQLLMDSLTTMAQLWVRSVALQYHISLPKRDEQLSKVVPFGSHGLGVDAPTSDVDVILLAPHFISINDHFFGETNEPSEHASYSNINYTCFLDIIRSDNHVQNICVLRDAYAPVIRFLFRAIKVDIQCATVTQTTLPFRFDVVLHNSLLTGGNLATIRSTSGLRASSFLLETIPNLHSFRCLLRMIKLWATRRCIYSNMHGYLSGISLAIMVARICRIYEGYHVVSLLGMFFKTYSAWHWAAFPSWKPVRLIADSHGGLWQGWQSWTPPDTYYRNPMQIICPVPPYTNTSYNVCVTTHKVILEELARANEIVQKMNQGKRPIEETLTQLIQAYRFDDRFGMFVIVEVSADSSSDQLEWKNFVECRLRRLTYQLEQTHKFDIIRAFPQHVSSDKIGLKPHVSFFVLGLVETVANDRTGEATDHNEPYGQVKRAISQWKAMVISYKYRKRGMELVVRFSRKPVGISDSAVLKGCCAMDSHKNKPLHGSKE